MVVVDAMRGDRSQHPSHRHWAVILKPVSRSLEINGYRDTLENAEGQLHPTPWKDKGLRDKAKKGKKAENAGAKF